MKHQHGDVDVATEAMDVLGWEMTRDGFIVGQGNLKFPILEEDSYEEGFFRPDQHYKHTAIVLAFVKQKLGVEHSTTWKGRNARISFVGKKHEVSAVADWGESNSVLCACALAFYNVESDG